MIRPRSSLWIVTPSLRICRSAGLCAQSHWCCDHAWVEPQCEAEQTSPIRSAERKLQPTLPDCAGGAACGPPIVLEPASSWFWSARWR